MAATNLLSGQTGSKKASIKNPSYTAGLEDWLPIVEIRHTVKNREKRMDLNIVKSIFLNEFYFPPIFLDKKESIPE